LIRIKKELSEIKPKVSTTDFKEQFKPGTLVKISGLKDITKN